VDGSTSLSSGSVLMPMSILVSMTLCLHAQGRFLMMISRSIAERLDLDFGLPRNQIVYCHIFEG
jgi:hypothetical protein